MDIQYTCTDKKSTCHRSRVDDTPKKLEVAIVITTATIIIAIIVTSIITSITTVIVYVFETVGDEKTSQQACTCTYAWEIA